MPFSLLYAPVIFLVLSAKHAVANVLLSPQNITLPLGENGTFSCVSTTHTVWRVNNDTIYTKLFIDESESVEEFADKGIFINFLRSGDNYTSVLTITGNARNNFTMVQCTVAMSISSNLNFTGQVAFLRVLGPPDPVNNLEVSMESKNGVIFSWPTSFSPYSVSVRYQVEVEDDNSAVVFSEETRSTSLLQTFPEGFCSVLKIRICASNQAGKSSQSNFTSSMLTKPSTASSLHHNLTFQNGEIACTIKFDSVIGCQAYPVTHYLIFLQEVNSSFGLLGSSKHPRFNVNSPSIRENSKYSYTVRAVNSINVSSDIEAQEFFTTDVQTSVAFLTPDSVRVQCTFIPGSQSRGCHAKLVGSDRSMKSHNIERIDGLNSVQDVFMISAVPADIFVFDWERDGSIGNLSVPVDIMRIISTVGPSSGLGTAPLDPEEDTTNVMVVIGGVVGGLLFGLLFILLTLSACAFIIIFRRRKGMDRQLHEHNPSPYEVCCGTASTNGRTNTPRPDVLNQNESLYAQISEENDYATYNHLSYSMVLNPAQQTQVDGDHYAHIGKDSAYEVIDKPGRSKPPPPPPLPPPLPSPRYSTHQLQRITPGDEHPNIPAETQSDGIPTAQIQCHNSTKTISVTTV